MSGVKIRQSIEIQCDEGKWFHVPGTLLEEYEGVTYLRLRASSHTIVALVSQTSAKKNACFSNSPKLQELVKLRNRALEALHLGEDGTEDGEEKEDMWQDAVPQNETAAGSKTRKVQENCGSHVVQISVADQPVHILCQGTRPWKGDLLVKLVPEELAAVIAFLKDGVSDALNAAKRQYVKKSKKAD